MILYKKREEYRYRRFYQYTQYILALVLTFGLISMWIMILILEKGLSKEIYREVEAAGIIFTVILSLCITFFLYSAGIYRKARLVLSEGAIYYIRGRRKMEIAIKDIIQIKIRKLSLFGGSMHIKTGELVASFKVDMKISNASNFLKKFWYELEHSKKENLKISGDFLKLYNTACFADQSWDRLKDISLKFLLIIIFSSATGVLLVIHKQASLRVSLMSISVSTAAPFLGYMIAELLIAWNYAERLKKDTSDPSVRNKINEYKIYKVVLILYIVVFAVAQSVVLII